MKAEFSKDYLLFRHENDICRLFQTFKSLHKNIKKLIALSIAY